MSKSLRPVLGLLLICSCVVGIPALSSAYSVITHEAIIDAEWERVIKPVLLRRFPNATPDELRAAQAYAYGGSVIQDLGYYPFGSRLFSHLTHYVRTGEFVRALIDESRDLNDYAFALGALSHYDADIEGHFYAVNRSVPLLYPDLRRKYGASVSWEDSPWAHSLTEFGFDTVEVVDRHVAPQRYHDQIGFKVPKGVLERAFKRTYGLELGKQVFSVRILLFVYRNTAGKIIPEMSEVAWAARRKEIEESARSMPHRRLYHLPNQTYAEWQKFYEKPGMGDKMMAFAFRLIPKFGPLNVFRFNPPTPATEKMFAESLKKTIESYESDVKTLENGTDGLHNLNLDTGRLTEAGEYNYCDLTYSRLLNKLAHKHFAGLSPDLRENILAYYEDAPAATLGRSARQRRKLDKQLQALRALDTDNPIRAAH